MDWRGNINEIHREKEEGTGRERRRRGEQKQEGRQDGRREKETERYREEWAEKEKSIFSANGTIEYSSVTHLPAL